MKKCGENCDPICDFCSNYDLSGKRRHGEDGRCRITKKYMGRTNGCKQFSCVILTSALQALQQHCEKTKNCKNCLLDNWCDKTQDFCPADWGPIDELTGYNYKIKSKKIKL
jgi:hypothetical protein